MTPVFKPIKHERLAALLQRRRQELGISQRTAATAIGISKATVSHHECGDHMPAKPALRNYSQVYNVPFPDIKRAYDVQRSRYRELYRQNQAIKQQRMRAGRELARARGSHADGAPSYGMQIVKFGNGKALIPDPVEQATIALIKALRANGRSYRDIAAVLNRHGVPAKRGGQWHPLTVSRALK